MNPVTALAQWFRDMRTTNVMELRAAGTTLPPWQTGKPQWMRPSLERYDREVYRKIGLAFRCIQYLSNATGAAPLRVYDPATDEADDEHPLRQLLARPNAGMGGEKFLAFIAMVAAISGYCVIEKERDRAGRVIGLYPLRSDWIRPIARQNAEHDWEYRVPGWKDPFLLPAADVIPFTWADTPDGSPLGIGPVEVMLREAQISSALTDFLKVFMDRGALPLYALIPQDEGPGAAQWKNPETVDAVMAAWEARYGQGLTSAARPLPLLGVKDVKPIGFDFNELAYPELNDLTDARICTTFGVSPILIDAQVGLDQSSYNNKGEARRGFYEDTMTYLWGRLDDAFTRRLLPEFETRPGWDIKFDTSGIPALQDNQNELWTRSTAALQAGGISTHTYHRLLNLEPEGPNVFLRSFNVIEIPVTAEGTRARRASVQVIEATGTMRALPEPPFERRDGRLYRNERALTPAQRQLRSQVGDNTKRRIRTLADLLGPAVATFLQDQRGRVLAGISERGRDGAPELRTVFLNPDWLIEDDLLRQVFAAWWEELQASVLDQAGTLLGTDITWTVTNPYINDLDGVLGQRIIGINETTRKAIEEIVKAEMLEGTSPAKLGDAIKGLFEQTYRNRHLTIAATESMVAYGEASQLAYEASGVVERVEILDNSLHTETYDGAEDGLTCAKRNGLIVPLKRGSFHIRSDHPNGSACMIPVVELLGGVE
jgi:HK97 family phage portal protein